jgi:hypothetical protein
MPAFIECTKREHQRNASGLAKGTAVEGLYFKLSSGKLTDLAGLPQLSRLRELRTTADQDVAELTGFLAAPALTGLRRLELFFHTEDDDPRPGLDLLRLPAVQGLRELDLTWTGSRSRDEAPGRDELFGFEFPSLRALGHHSGLDTTQDVRALLAGPFLPRLEDLRVLVKLTPEDADLLAAASGRAWPGCGC